MRFWMEQQYSWKHEARFHQLVGLSSTQSWRKCHPRMCIIKTGFQKKLWLFHGQTWFPSDMRKSKLCPGRAISRYILMRRRSAEFPSKPWTQITWIWPQFKIYIGWKWKRKYYQVDVSTNRYLIFILMMEIRNSCRKSQKLTETK